MFFETQAWFSNVLYAASVLLVLSEFLLMEFPLFSSKNRYEHVPEINSCVIFLSFSQFSHPKVGTCT